MSGWKWAAVIVAGWLAGCALLVAWLEIAVRVARRRDDQLRSARRAAWVWVPEDAEACDPWPIDDPAWDRLVAQLLNETEDDTP
jgi:hypothetical protein